MFTIKVIEETENYFNEDVFQCKSYSRIKYKGDITDEENGNKIRSADSKFDYLELYCDECEDTRIDLPHPVLDKDSKRIIYVMNSEGKTIDTY